MKLPKFRRKYVAGALAVGLIMGAGGIAAAYFGVTGSGTGSARAGTAANVKIRSVGAGYNSIIPSTGNPYKGSQCFTCASVSELGDKVTLANSTLFTQVSSVTVALVNFGAGTTGTVTLNLQTGLPNGNFTTTKKFPFAEGSATTQVVTNVTFTFATTPVFVYQQFVYGVSVANAPTVNIALVDPVYDQTVGTSTFGQLWVKASNTGSGLGIPSCADIPSPTYTKFVAINTACTTSTFAWGTLAQATNTGNIDLPAVTFNVVGGLVGPLYPGAPASHVDFAVTNPGPSAAHLTTVTTTLGTLTGTCAAHTTWFHIYGPTSHVNRTFPSGTTIVTNSGTTIAMLTSGTTQDACKTATIPLTFAGTHA